MKMNRVISLLTDSVVDAVAVAVAVAVVDVFDQVLNQWNRIDADCSAPVDVIIAGDSVTISAG